MITIQNNYLTRKVVLILLVLILLSICSCGISQKATEDPRNDPITFSDSPNSKSLSLVGYGIGEFLGMKMGGYQSSVLSGINTLAVYIRSNNVPRFYDDRNLLACTIVTIDSQVYKQSYITSNYQIEKVFWYTDSNGVTISSRPLNHDQGTFYRAMSSSVTLFKSASSWINRTAAYRTSREAFMSSYSSGDVQVDYISREIEHQESGEGAITQTGATSWFKFTNFKVDLDVEQEIVPGSVTSSISGGNSVYVTDIDLNEGIPYVVDPVNKIIAYQGVTLNINVYGQCKSGEGHPDDPITEHDVWTGNRLYSKVNKQNEVRSSVPTARKQMTDAGVWWVKVFDYDGTLLAEQTHNHQTDSTIDYFFNNAFNVFFLFDEGTYIDDWDAYDALVRGTWTGAFDRKQAQVEDSNWIYHVYIDNGKVMYEQKSRNGNTTEFKQQVGYSSDAKAPAINKDGNNIYVSWVQNGNKLYMNNINGAGSVSMSKTGEGDATIEMDFEAYVPDGYIVTGHVKLINTYYIEKTVKFGPANYYTGGEEEVIVCQRTKTTGSGVVYRDGGEIGKIKEDSLFGGDFIIIDNATGKPVGWFEFGQ